LGKQLVLELQRRTCGSTHLTLNVTHLEITAFYILAYSREKLEIIQSFICGALCALPTIGRPYLEAWTENAGASNLVSVSLLQV
jgi:hypothetical protein